MKKIEITLMGEKMLETVSVDGKEVYNINNKPANSYTELKLRLYDFAGGGGELNIHQTSDISFG